MQSIAMQFTGSGQGAQKWAIICLGKYNTVHCRCVLSGMIMKMSRDAKRPMDDGDLVDGE